MCLLEWLSKRLDGFTTSAKISIKDVLVNTNTHFEEPTNKKQNERRTATAAVAAAMPATAAATLKCTVYFDW